MHGIRTVVSGFGLVTALGDGAWGTFRALLEGRTIWERAAGLWDGTDPVDLVRAVGGVAAAQHSASDPAVDLAERAAREAMTMAGVGVGDDELGCVVAASKGAVGALVQAAQKYGVSGRVGDLDADGRVGAGLVARLAADLARVVALGPQGYLADHLQRRLGVRLVGQTVAACASGLAGVHQGRMYLNDWQRDKDGFVRPRCRKLLVVSSEASLLPLFIHSYRRLGVLPPLTPEGYRGRPLDRRRNGFVLSEVGAAVVLEAVEEVRPGQIELVDTAVACEGYDLIRAAPGLPALNAVAERLLGGREIDLLHPHATGTAENDAAELSTYARYLDSGVTDVYAHKGALGHGLGASGLVSLVLACLCGRVGKRPVMGWLDEPVGEGEVGFRVSKESRVKGDGIHQQAVFAAGFGGHVAGAVVRQR